MFDPIEKGIGCSVKIVVGFILMLLLCCGSVFALATMRQYGLSDMAGEFFRTSTEVAIQEALPSLGEITGPSAKVVQTEISSKLTDLRPAGQKELFGGRIVIDYDRFGVSVPANDEITIKTYGPDGVTETKVH